MIPCCKIVIKHRMCDQVNSHCTNHTFNIDDWVYVHLQPYRQQFVECKCQKISPHYSGSCQILLHIGVANYELHLPTHSRIHPIFHVSLLCIFREQKTSTSLNSLKPNPATNSNSEQPSEPHLTPSPNTLKIPPNLATQNTPRHPLPAAPLTQDLEPLIAPTL